MTAISEESLPVARSQSEPFQLLPSEEQNKTNNANTRSLNEPKSYDSCISVNEFVPKRLVTLEEELKEFSEMISLPVNSITVRANMIDRIRLLLFSLSSTAQLKVFGSFTTTLGLFDCDIDCTVSSKEEKVSRKSFLYELQNQIVQSRLNKQSELKLPKCDLTPFINEENKELIAALNDPALIHIYCLDCTLKTIALYLRHSLPIHCTQSTNEIIRITTLGTNIDSAQVETRANAAVPITTFVDENLGIHIDVSINSENGVKNTQHVFKLVNKYEALRPVVLFVKFLLKSTGLNDVYSGGLGSYAITIMTSFVIEHFSNIRLNYRSGDEKNPAIVLLEFLKFFGANEHVNFRDQGISLTSGFFYKRERNWYSEERNYYLSIEDPEETTNDLGSKSFNISAIRNLFRSEFIRLLLATCDINEKRFRSLNYEEIPIVPKSYFRNARALRIQKMQINKIRSFQKIADERIRAIEMSRSCCVICSSNRFAQASQPTQLKPIFQRPRTNGNPQLPLRLNTERRVFTQTNAYFGEVNNAASTGKRIRNEQKPKSTKTPLKKNRAGVAPD